MKIVKNTTLADIFLSDVGIHVPASGQYTIYENEYPLWAAATTESPDSPLTALVKSGDIVVNDGTTDLSVAVGLLHLQTGIRIVQTSITDEAPAPLINKIVAGYGVTITEIGIPANKQLEISYTPTELSGTTPVKYEYGGNANPGRVLEYAIGTSSFEVPFIVVSDGKLRAVTFHSSAVITGTIGLFSTADTINPIYVMSLFSTDKKIEKPLDIDIYEGDELYAQVITGSINKPIFVIYIQTI